MHRLCVVALMFVAVMAGAAEDFAYVRSATVADGEVIVDTRALAECRAKSLAGARCLPADGFLGPHRRLPSARDLLWVLGSAGLSGGEGVLVIGQDVTARDFVAGLLYIAGQRRVRVLTEPVGRALEGGAVAGAGQERGMIRQTVFVAPMRDDALVLFDELRAMRPPPLLLDGRSDTEYWGVTARAQRTGHLPGAVSLPATQLRAALGAPTNNMPVLPDGSPVAYAHDAFEGLAYLTLLTAGHGVSARLYAQGWAQWAADGALPADAVGYPERPPPVSAQRESRSDGVSRIGAFLSGAALLALLAFAIGRSTGKPRAT